MARKAIPDSIKNKVLDEYNHRCAMCGCDRPHLHHIDEDATNNDPENLLPLCPNCHLIDQHNPTKKMDIEKLKLFRAYKDPAILNPQFEPIYRRFRYLLYVDNNEDNIDILAKSSHELIDLISSFTMGDFYGKQLSDLIKPEGRVRVCFSDGPTWDEIEMDKKYNNRYRNMLIKNRNNAIALIIEQLRYQPWANNE